MVHNIRKLLLFCAFAWLPVTTFAQNARQYFRTGLSFTEAGNHTDAIDQYTKAIVIDPQYVQAYVERARAYEAISDLQNAADDLKRAITFDEKDPALFFTAARIHFALAKNDEALDLIGRCISRDRKSDEAFRLQARVQMALEDYSASLSSINRALEIRENAPNFYYRAQLSEIMKNPAQAESDYKKAIDKDAKYSDAYLALGMLKLRTGKPTEAIDNCNTILESDPLNKEALMIRSRAFANLTRYPEAIDDISKILASHTENRDMYFTRGTYYQEFTQHQAAINDFSKVLLLDPVYADAIFRRAYSYEQVGDFESAIKDYERLIGLSSDDITAQNLLNQARQRLYELNRESVPPEIILTEPVVQNDSSLKIPRTIRHVHIRGIIRDQSDVSRVVINKRMASVLKNADHYEFSVEVDVSVTDIITIHAQDVYDNIKTGIYSITRTETDAPMIAIMAPYASDNGEIYLDTDNPNLYVEGRIADESRIESILIDDITASFAINDLNPSFTAVINVANKNKFNVKVTDVYGNDTTIAYILNREGISMLEKNPMGRTWVVFIENSNYETFPSLDGPAKDVSLMRSALAGYDIHKIIHKQDMNKKEMERFFSIELRDLLRSNKVNSLMIWYAGHGKYYNETGYWIPADARRDDEFTYYNLNALRASLQSFSNNVTHSLIISDACESGATFNQAMREAPSERNCSDWEAVKFKSAQAFTSAGYEIAADHSQFTKTFANMLSNSPNACLPIEMIVNKVIEAVKQTSSQSPRFGKISGLEDEGGTFFFMSKIK
jgi:tetratricopeptide (TPR) repeat protein